MLLKHLGPVHLLKTRELGCAAVSGKQILCVPDAASVCLLVPHSLSNALPLTYKNSLGPYLCSYSRNLNAFMKNVQVGREKYFQMHSRPASSFISVVFVTGNWGQRLKMVKESENYSLFRKWNIMKWPDLKQIYIRMRECFIFFILRQMCQITLLLKYGFTV